MGLAFKRVANGKGCIRWRGQSVGRRELRANVATRVADHLGVIFQPEQEAFFQLANELIHVSTFARPILVAQIALENLSRATLGKSVLCELNTTRNFITCNQCARMRD